MRPIRTVLAAINRIVRTNAALATTTVAYPTDDDGAQRPRNEPDPKHGEGRQQGRRLIAGWEEVLGDDGGKKAVDDEVVPFENVANHRGGDRPVGVLPRSALQARSPRTRSALYSHACTAGSP